MNSDKKQLTLIFSLLAVLVILPTVCMLWFVVRASQNEQLAIKQRLTDKYKAECRQLIYYDINNYLQDQIFSAHKLFKQQYDKGRDVCYQVLHENNTSSEYLFDYMYTVERLGPAINRNDDFEESIPDIFNTAEELEFQKNELLLAAEEYQRIANDSKKYTQTAILGKIRCLRKAGNLKDAIEQCQTILDPARNVLKKNTSRYWQTKLLLAEMYSQAGRSELPDTLSELNQCALEIIPYSTKIFILSRAIELIESNNFQDKLKNDLDIAIKELDYSKKLSWIEDKHSRGMNIDSSLTFVGDDIFDQSYFAYYGYDTISPHLVYCFICYPKLKAYFESKMEIITDDMMFLNVTDPRSLHRFGEDVLPIEDPQGRMQYHETIFLDEISYDPLKGWNLWCAFRPGVFGSGAEKYKLAYFWTAILVLVFAGAAAIVVGRLLLKQARVNRLKNDFIATVTHELKTPLTSTRMLIDTLLDGKYDNQAIVEEYLRIISSENSRLNSLIDNFLTFSRMERSKEVFDKQKIRINDLLNDAAILFNKKDKKNLEFSVTNLDENRLILVDAQAMLTVILNLLSNAWKYTDKETKTIELRAYSELSRVFITVKDNGIGISARQQKKIFDRFYRVDNSLSRVAEGTGIGLTIVKFIVDAHGGTITVNSRPGIGSEFTICLGSVT